MAGWLIAILCLALVAGTWVSRRDRRRVRACLQSLAESGGRWETAPGPYPALHLETAEGGLRVAALPAGAARLMAGEKAFGRQSAVVYAEIPVPTGAGREFRLLPTGRETAVDRRLGWQRLETGDAVFDARFACLAEAPEWLRPRLDGALRGQLVAMLEGRCLWVDFGPRGGRGAGLGEPVLRVSLRGIPRDCADYRRLVALTRSLAAALGD